MKHLLLLLLWVPPVVFAQKIKINEFDKYVKQKRIEFEPLTIYSTPKANVSLSLKSIGSQYYVTISGYGWGVSTISYDNDAILLLSNDSTVVVKSTGTQTYDINSANINYKHHYTISLKDVEMLMRHNLIGIRKYNIQDFSDLDVPAQYGQKVKQMGAMFINELYKGKVLLALKNINEKDVGKHVGDSVRLCTKINSTSYFELAANKPTFLNAGIGNNHLFTAVILEHDRPKFNKAPEIIYADKEVCLCGVVQVADGKPQIVLRDRDQIVIKTPIAVEEVANYIGDSITVTGTVHNGLFYTENDHSYTILNMGAPYPDPLLTAVITGNDLPNFVGEPENYYANKNISITGKVLLKNGKPQILLRDKSQIALLKQDPLAFARSTTSAQSSKAAVSTPLVSTKAEYPGGKAALMNFIKDNLSHVDGVEQGNKITVIARFLLKKDGTASNFEIKESGGERFDNEVLRILKKMPKWNPEIVEGRPTEIHITIPVTFINANDGSVHVPGI